MGCFSTPKYEARRSPSLPRYGQRGGGREREFSLLSNKPVELPDPKKVMNSFSGPLEVGANYFSADDDGRKRTVKSLRRATSFGGRPQPLPLPAGEETPPRRRPPGGVALPVPRLARVAPVGGLPLPSPFAASKLLVFELREIQLATEEFAERFCVERGVYRARLKDDDAALLRLPENAVQGIMEWKADVLQLAQLSDPNVCALKGYCAHERKQERLLVFERPSNGTLYEKLFGGRGALDWTTRIDIALGAARGLLYIHDRASPQVVYKKFKAAHVLLEDDFSPKLAGYGLAVVHPSNGYAKQNVRSFGVLLLELLTGKSSLEASYFGDDDKFVQWGKQYFKDEGKLSLIIDPRMKVVTGAKEVVALLLQCVSRKEALRPSMSEVVASLKAVKVNHCSTALRGKKGLPSWVLSPTRQTRHLHTYSDMQTSSDAYSSSENEDFFVSKLALRPLRTVV